MPIPDLDVRRVTKWCEEQMSPLHMEELRVEADVTSTSVTIVEATPPWSDSSGERIRFPIARLRFTASTGLWSLYWRDHHLKFHRYDRVRPTRRVQVLLDFIADSGDPIFWG